MPDTLCLRDDPQVSDSAVPVDTFLNQTNAAAVRIEPGEDARLLIPHLEQIRLVEVNFPAHTDGRGYSSARLLREAGYGGEMRAVGDVLVDQLSHLKRCGFDSFTPDVPFDQGDAQTALGRWPDVYQATGDGRQPIWAKRHAEPRNG